MKSDFIIKRILSIAIAVLLVMLGSITAFAVDLDGDGIDDEPSYIETQPIVETQPAFSTEPVYTEPETTEPVYTEPETTEPQETTTEPITEQTTTNENNYTEPTTFQEQTQSVTQLQTIPSVEDFTLDPEVPTVSKTVSEKDYSTNKTAGIISWACVLGGILIVFLVMTGTKLSGKKNAHSENYLDK